MNPKAPQPGLGLTEYLRYCALVDVEPNRNLTPIERRQSLPRWLTPELTCNNHAREHLQDWVRAGKPQPEREHLNFVGAESVRNVVLRGLRRIPAPVRWHVIEHCTIFEVGAAAIGWHFGSPPWKPHTIILFSLLADAELMATFAHEAAHSWTTPLPAADPAPVHQRRAHRRLVTGLAREWGYTWRHIVKPAEDAERQAAALCKQWGFSGRAGDAEHCAAAGRIHALREVAV